MDNINGIPLIWDEEGDKKLFGSLFPNGLQPPNNNNNPFKEIERRGNNLTPIIDEIRNEYALSTPFGKDSHFYRAKQGSVRRFFADKNQYEKLKGYFSNIDLENIQLSGTVKEITAQEEPYFCNSKKLQIVQHNIKDGFENYFSNFYDVGKQQLKTYLDNFTWFLEGDQSNCITFHLFATDDYIKEVVCTMGSDIFDCLKITTKVNASGGFTIADEKGIYKVNPELNEFKQHLFSWLKTTYNDSNKIQPKFYLDEKKILSAIDNEFKAEGDYQRAVDWLFDKIGVTTAFKNVINDLKDFSKDIKKYRIHENQYLPFFPNFDPIFNDYLLKAFGISPNIKIEEYFKDYLFDDTEEIKKFQLQEKEVNWVYGFNAAFCGLWNALIDTADGFIEVIPALYHVFTDRGAFKQFLHFIKEFFENITELMGKFEEWELKKASYSVYRYQYTEYYAAGVILCLFIPMPKTGIGQKINETFRNAATKALETVNELTQSLLKFIKAEILALAYKMGFRVEKTGAEWQLICNDIVICTGTKEKIVKRIENIIEITAKKPNFVFKLLSEGRLKKLIDIKKGKGLGILSESERLLIQSKLFNANIAIAEFKVSFNGKMIRKELKAYSGSNISQLDKYGFCKSPNLRSGEIIEDFIDFTVEENPRRFLDTESKIFREFEDIHLKQIMKELGAKTTDELKIEVELQTVLDPCNVCQGQMDKFQKLYKAQIKIYSSGAQDGIILGKMYPKFRVEKPIKK